MMEYFELLTRFLETLSFHLVYYFSLTGIVFFVFYKLFRYSLQQFKIQQRNARLKDYIREISHSLLTIVILSFFGILILFTPLNSYTLVYNEWSFWGIIWFLPSILIALILHDTYFYWMHRFLHLPNLYKRFHLTHHQSTNPSPWASYSFHLIEGIAEGLVLPLIVFLIPMHFYALILFTLFAFLINVYGHLGYEIAPRKFRDSFWFTILNTSVYHNLHHRKFKGNYGLYFRFWDKIMHTESPRYIKEYDKIQHQRFGKIREW